MTSLRPFAGAALAALVGMACPGPAAADCVQDVGSVPGTLGPILFPNWAKAPLLNLTILECDDTTCSWCTNGPMSGLTIVNRGNATSADLTGLFFELDCGKTSSGVVPMTFAGVWNFPWGNSPAWTWAGVPPVWPDACNGCACSTALTIYGDVAACPVDGRTVQLGVGYNDVLNPAWPGGLQDSCGCAGPWTEVTDPDIRFIKYVAKIGDRASAAPGDTVTYTVYYGKPGTAALAGITIFDSLPPYTHYVAGSGTPPPDPGWDPDFGPPLRLKWSRPGGATAGGATAAVTFELTVDWGNGESFEPGSGDVAAPEGARLNNLAQATFIGTNCPSANAWSDPSLTVVRRFLFWKVADNDVLFSLSYGQPSDEITYSIFLKNLSLTKTWWNVSVWDTVPVELDTWGTNFGLDDPCSGWTMTPSGCAAGSPGSVVAGTRTVLTWKIDMPPQATLELRWKAVVKPNTTAGATAVAVMSLLELGRSGIIDGTGHSTLPAKFIHQAAIILPTTYTSYLSIGATSDSSFGCCNADPLLATQTYWIPFFPLNKKADFNLYEQLHTADAYVTDGGASPSVNAYVGGCLTGGAGWTPGCKVERAPAFYYPLFGVGCPSLIPFHHLYKVISNSPLLWEMLAGSNNTGGDSMTYVGTTSLSYAGYVSYTYPRVCSVTNFDGLYLINTSDVTPTTTHVFRWNAATLSWAYLATQDIGVESQWFFDVQGQSTSGAHKVISSDAPLIIFKAFPGIGVGGAFNDQGASAPNKENGFLVSGAAPATFYAYVGVGTASVSLLVGNAGAANASYEIWEYFSDTPTVANPSTPHLTPQLLGSSGRWALLAVDGVPAGLANPANGHIYGAGGYDGLITDTFTMYKIVLQSGGPIQVYNGRNVYSGYGCGSAMHAVPPPSGNTIWFHEGDATGACKGTSPDLMTLDVFCPKGATVVTAQSSDGAQSAYTTPGPDSVVSFRELTTPNTPLGRNWRITSVGGPMASGLQIHCQLQEKIYTAPFLAQGVHYQIVVPPVVYIGQSFWITVLVLQTAGGTLTDYCGSTSFTSTDPGAKIENQPMDSYNYTWDSNDPGAVCKGAGCIGTCDNGVKLFFNVSMTRLGLQSIVGQDTGDGSITGIATLMVVGVDVKFTKTPRLVVSASGDTVQFRVCWSNYSSASAFTFVITDAIPMGTAFVPEAGTAAFDCGNTDGIAPRVAYSQTAQATPPATFTEGNPTNVPSPVKWLRWTIPAIGIQTTGCICYRVTVN